MSSGTAILPQLVHLLSLQTPEVSPSVLERLRQLTPIYLFAHTIPSMDASQWSEHARPKVDQSAYNYTLSEAETSYAGSMAGTDGYKRSREDDDAQTRVSTYSYQSDRDASKYLRQVDGRVSHRFSRDIAHSHMHRQ